MGEREEGARERGGDGGCAWHCIQQPISVYNERSVTSLAKPQTLGFVPIKNGSRLVSTTLCTRTLHSQKRFTTISRRIIQLEEEIHFKKQLFLAKQRNARSQDEETYFVVNDGCFCNDNHHR